MTQRLLLTLKLTWWTVDVVAELTVAFDFCSNIPPVFLPLLILLFTNVRRYSRHRLLVYQVPELTMTLVANMGIKKWELRSQKEECEALNSTRSFDSYAGNHNLGPVLIRRTGLCRRRQNCTGHRQYEECAEPVLYRQAYSS